MEKKDFLIKVAAGSFFLTGLLLIVVIVFAIGLQKGLTQPKFQVAVVYHQIGGLAEGSAVSLSGVKVGTVKQVRFLDQDIQGRGVEVTLNVYEKYRVQLERGQIFTIKPEGVLGEKIVEISRNTDGKRIDLAQPIIGDDPLDVQDLARIMADTALALQQTSDTVGSIVVEMKHISVTSKRVLDRIEERLIEGNLFKVF